MDLVKAAERIKKKHAEIEQQFDFERPVGSVDMRNPKEAMQHQHVGQSISRLRKLTGEAEPMGDHKRQGDRRPVSREKSAESRNEEIAGTMGPLQRHEDDESADAEKELYAVEAVCSTESGRRVDRVQLLVANGVVKEDHRRRYGSQQVLEVLTVAALRRKGLSLQKIRRLLRLLHRDLGQHFGAISTGPAKLYLLTDGTSIHLEEQAVVLERLSTAKGAMYLVCLSDLFKSISPQKPVRRTRSKQLPLF